MRCGTVLMEQDKPWCLHDDDIGGKSADIDTCDVLFSRLFSFFLNVIRVLCVCVCVLRSAALVTNLAQCLKLKLFSVFRVCCVIFTQASFRNNRTVIVVFLIVN